MSDSGDPKQDKQRELEAEREHYLPANQPSELETKVRQLTEAVWRLGRGTALDLPMNPELTPEEATNQILALLPTSQREAEELALDYAKKLLDLMPNESEYVKRQLNLEIYRKHKGVKVSLRTDSKGV